MSCHFYFAAARLPCLHILVLHEIRAEEPDTVENSILYKPIMPNAWLWAATRGVGSHINRLFDIACSVFDIS